jgi:hypothetical protein
MKKILFAALIAASVMPSMAVADEQFENWHTKKADGRCTAWSLPMDTVGEKRDGAFLSIVNVPAEGVKNSVAFVFGKPGVGKGSASAQVDGKTIELLTFDTAAFAASGAPEADLISAMRRGAEVSVNWVEEDGSIHKDTYSLKGVTAANNRIDQDCR